MADDKEKTKAESSPKPASPSSDKGGNAKSEKGALGQELTSTLFNAAPWAAGGGLLGALGGFLFTDGGENESSEERLKRRIRNAIRLGAMGTGVGGAVSIVKDVLGDDATSSKEDIEDAFYRLGGGLHKAINLFAKSDPKGYVSGAIYGGTPGAVIGGRIGFKNALRSRAEGLKAVQAALGNAVTKDNIVNQFSRYGDITRLVKGTPYDVGTSKYPIILESARNAVGRGAGSMPANIIKGSVKGLATGGGLGALLMGGLDWLTRDPKKPQRN